MSAKVFISHSSHDRKVAKTICTALESRGLVCWIASRDVRPGQNFQEAIVRAIRTAKVLVLVFTANANKSDEIKKELVLANQSKVAVIPVRVEDIEPNEALAYEFATRQWIDLFDDWEGEIERMASWIGEIVSIRLEPNKNVFPAASPRRKVKTAVEKISSRLPNRAIWIAVGVIIGGIASLILIAAIALRVFIPLSFRF